MTTVLRAPIAPPRGILRRPKSTTGFWSWWTTVDHKKIGILYGGLALVFFVVAGIEALLIRLQLARPERHGPHRVAVQHAVHDARHDDDLPRRHAARRPRSATT